MKKTLKNIPYITFSLVVGLALAAGITFAAWTATWHGTGWINSGETISAQKVAENFEYLKARIPDSCPDVGDVISWNGAGFSCAASGGGSSDPFLADNGHTSADCTAAGGSVYDTGLGYSICKSTGASCASGWIQKDNWSETAGRTCGGQYCPSCYTGQHAFDNRGAEACSYSIPNEEQQCYSGGVCRATVTDIGCY